MNRTQIIGDLRANADAMRGMGATALYLFGSVARGEASEDSDIDLFIDYDQSGDFSLIDLVGIEQYLEERIPHDIDVTTRDSLHPKLRTDIENGAIRVF